MSGTWWWRSTLGIAVVVLAVLVWLLTKSGSDPQATILPPPPGPGPVWSIVAADASGTVVFRAPDGPTVGVDREGRQSWTVPNADWVFAACAPRCPDAVLSGSIATVAQPQQPDPEVTWLTGGRTTQEAAGLPGQGPGKTLVFAAASRQITVAQRADLDGRTELVLSHPVHSVVVPMPRTTLANAWADASVSHVLALVPRRIRSRFSTAMWFTRDARGWHRVGSGRTAADGGCVAQDGSRAVLLGRSTQIVDMASSSLASPPWARTAGNCTFSSTGPVLLSNSLSHGHQRSVVTQLTPGGRLVWSQTTRGSVGTLSASQAGPDVAVATTDGTRVEVLSPSGRHGLPYADCAWVAGRSLVTVSDTGEVARASLYS